MGPGMLHCPVEAAPAVRHAGGCSVSSRPPPKHNQPVVAMLGEMGSICPACFFTATVFLKATNLLNHDCVVFFS